MVSAVLSILKTIAISVIIITIVSYISEYVAYLNTIFSLAFPTLIINVIYLTLIIFVAKFFIGRK